ncbi:hypothetical protein [Bacteroides helcogenes]|uniref:Transmembrane protein n=1 Tax=Bacteroides helcogenes (strain ATCC 35417 / DSM 20613 / JCM 6297 / CCUG 15421 / P 36-108) TaxID=693979 RepID=E6SS28_BACT6|nr:hypothetical protein [Bacteroides helcogenes]ADV43130.1 hypothetical protein Bache_1120 [Bacteroides helcogenes P 36-108]MDY5239108.1 hypothetical protein [Bacteroides helcogenes]
MSTIFYKEWIKTRWYLLLASITTLGFAGYSMLRINRIAELKGVEHVWEVMLSRDTVFVDLLEYIPLLIGIIFALVQFVPEMHRKCLKLTLHLPYPQLRMINLMLLYGLLALLACFITNFLLMLFYLQGILAPELYSRILLTAFPWYLAGISSYLLISWICLEPTWKRRIFNLAISILLLRIFFLAQAPEAYNVFLPWLVVYTLLTASLSWLSIARFKAGKQD